MALSRNLETACETILMDLKSDLVTRQETYRQRAPDGKREYFQGLPTRSAPPRDGERAAPDRTARATNQSENWQAFGAPLPAVMECSVRLDVYEGPLGRGWILRGFVEADGKVYARAVNFGPEVRDEDWHAAEQSR